MPTASRWLVLGALALACQEPAFACTDDANCEGLPEGACEDNGFCSTASDDCESGRAYAEHSGSLSGRCLEEPEGSTGDGRGSTSGDVSTSSGDGTGSSDTLALGEESTSTTGEGSTGDRGSTSDGGDTSSGGDGDASGAVMGPCGSGMLVFQEDFTDNELVEPDWNTNTVRTGDVSYADQALTIVVDEPDGMSAFWWAVASLDPPDAGAFGFELLSPPPGGTNGVMWMTLEVGPEELYLEYRPSDVIAMVRSGGGGFDVLHSIPLDMDAHRFGRLRYDVGQGAVIAELSGDSVEWSPMYEFDTQGLNFDQLLVSLGGGVTGGGGGHSGSVATVDNVRLCEL